MSIKRSKPVVDAKERLYFSIKRKRDLKGAIRCDKSNCVIKQALQRSIGEINEIVNIEVGGSMTFIELKEKILRYKTPGILRDALVVFDDKSEWSLKDGEYHLLPPAISAKAESRKRHNRATDFRRNHNALTRTRRASISPRHIQFLADRKKLAA